MDNHRYNLHLWKKVVEKIVDTEIKANLQPSSRTKKIDFKCSKSYKSTKKNKNKAH